MQNYRYKKIIITYGDGHTEESFIIQERIFWKLWLNVKQANEFVSWNYSVHSEEKAKEEVKRLESRFIVSKK